MLYGHGVQTDEPAPPLVLRDDHVVSPIRRIVARCQCGSPVEVEATMFGQVRRCRGCGGSGYGKEMPDDG